MTRLYSCCAAASLLIVSSAGLALGQANPLEAPPPPPAGNPLAPQPANPLAPADNPAAANAFGKVFAPDFITPGMRIVYRSGSSQENEDPRKPASAGTGALVYELVAVQDNRVVLQGLNYLERNGGFQFVSGSPQVVTQMQVIGGGAPWIDPQILAGFQSDQQTHVTSGPLELNGRTYETTTLTRISRETASRLIYDRGTGLMLANQLGTGPSQRGAEHNPFYRRVNSQSQFLTYRVQKLPWAGAPTPEWAKTVRRMSFQCRNVMSIPNGQPVAIPFTSEVEFTERGEGWAMGTSTNSDANGGPPTRGPMAMAENSISTYWINPDVLQRMQPGVIDEDPTLQTRVTYNVEDRQDGRYGVVKETNSVGSYEVVRAYSFRDGGLVYARMSVQETGMTTELSLAGRQ